MKYRKKPVVIEAIQLDGKHTVAEMDAFLREDVAKVRKDYGGLVIETLEGNMYASPGDWIIRGVKGELYPCKPDIFEATYEHVEAGATI